MTKTNIQLPRVISGTSILGNLYEELSFDRKKELVQAFIEANNGIAVFDTAGKYGAGLALETLGRCLRELGISPDDVIISNKLGWVRTPLLTDEPTFERGVWKNLSYDAEQSISYDGIISCFEQGNELLQTFTPQLASVHDPDEYLAAAKNEEDAARRYNDILEAYRALHDLKSKGLITGIGVGSKTWKTIERISNDVSLDWVMLANSLTIYHHPQDLLSFVQRLNDAGITIINSALFHGGFLTGSNYFNYQLMSEDNPEHKQLFDWRNRFYSLCKEFDIEPAAACICFGLNIPGVCSVALNSSSPLRTKKNIAMVHASIPNEFWARMKEERLIDPDYSYV